MRLQVRCLVDVPGEKLPHDMAQYLEHVVVPEIPEQLRPAFREAVAAGSWRSMRNKSMPARPLHRPGALLLGEQANGSRMAWRIPAVCVASLLQHCGCWPSAGDAFNMRHPLTGGGMTVALSDAALLSDMLQPLPNFADQLATAHETAAFYTKRKPLSATINTLANALYRVSITHCLTARWCAHVQVARIHCCHGSAAGHPRCCIDGMHW